MELDESSEEDEAPTQKSIAKYDLTPAPVDIKDESSSDDDSSDEDEASAAKPAPKAAPAKPATAGKKEESSSDEWKLFSDEDEAPKKPAAKSTPAKPDAVTKEETSSDDDDNDEEEVKPVKAAIKPKTLAKKEESSSEDSSDNDDEPAAKNPVAKATPKKEGSDIDDSSSEEEEADEPVKKVVKEEDDGGMKIKKNKGKTVDDFKTPTKADQSFGDKSFWEEGRKIFIHNVGEEMVYETFKEQVEKFGEVTDFFNPGRGFAFLTFSSAEEAQACIKAMDNTRVGGNNIQMNIARPKGEKPPPGTGGKRLNAPEGCKLFVHGVTQVSVKTTYYSYI